MIKEIKDFKLKEIDEELRPLQQLKEELKSITAEQSALMQKINAQRQLIPYRYFNWIQKHITKRKEYRDHRATIEDGEKSIDPIYKRERELSKRAFKINSELSSYGSREFQLQRELEETR